jgi:hypothetical protein
MFKLIIRSMLAATVIATLCGVVTQAQAEPAAAATITAVVGPQAVQDCPSEYACLWTGTGWEGQRWQGKNRNNTLPAYIDRKSLSSANHGIHSVACFWTGQNGTGQVFPEGIGSIRQDLRLNTRPGGNWGLVIRSLTWGNC